MSEFDQIKANLSVNLQQLDGLLEKIKMERDNLFQLISEKEELFRFGQIDRNLLDDFFIEPYAVVPKRENEWYVIAPRWLNFQLGYLERSTKGYNFFVVNRYLRMFKNIDIPKQLADRLKFTESLPLKVYDGMLLTGKEMQEEAMNRYKHFVSRREGEDRLRVKQGYEFKLIAQLVEDGTLPFMTNPVNPEDLRDFQFPQLRPYQQDAWNEFLKTGANGIFWSFGAGKSFFGLYALGKIKGKKLVVVSYITLAELWRERINKYLPQYRNEIDVVTYHAYDKVAKNEYSLILFDECQHLPANTFVRLATLKTKYRMGFSGSPYREDGRENYIIALTGFPIGMSWEELIRQQVVRKPVFTVYILVNNTEKIRKLAELLKLPMKTLIFCDWLDFGNRISRTFEIPFIHGQTQDRLEILRKSQTAVISRVGDEGISLPDLERVIEVAFLFGSRMQESQRFGRLMHSQKDEPQHIILMTEQEFEQYQKRLFSIIERGFQIEYIR